MKKIIIYISFTVLVYVVCIFLDGTEKVHFISDEMSVGRKTLYDYHLLHRNEYVYNIYRNEEKLLKETLYIDWDSVVFFPYLLIVISIIELLKIKRKKDYKALPFFKNLKEEKNKEIEIRKLARSYNFPMALYNPSVKSFWKYK